MPGNGDGGVSLGAHGDLLEGVYKVSPDRSGTSCRRIGRELPLSPYLSLSPYTSAY